MTTALPADRTRTGTQSKGVGGEPHSERSSSMNLHGLALEIVRENGSPDPSVLAKSLVDKIKPKDYRKALDQMARQYVRVVMTEDARRRGNGGGKGRGSAKVANAREAWQRILNSPEYVPSIGEWLHLRDATREQVLEMGELRMVKARENEAAAQLYFTLAKKMKTAKAEHVIDVDQTVILDLFGQRVAA
jgi:hypothetical protein